MMNGMLWICILLSVWAQDEIITETLDTRDVVADFEYALSEFNSVRRPQSKDLFEELVAYLEAKPGRTPEQERILRESLELLGWIVYPTGTEDYYERLIRLDPGYRILRNMPPKIAAIFDDLRKQLVGTLRMRLVEDTDSNAAFLVGGQIFVDDELRGMLAGDTRTDVLAGEHVVRVEKINFDMFQQEVLVPAGDEVLLDGVLYRNASEINLVTVPTGVKVFLDNVEVGVTQGAFSEHQDSAPQLLQSLLKQGVSPSEASGIFSIDRVPLGVHRIRVEKPCYQTKVFGPPELTTHKRLFLEPVMMTHSKAGLEVTSVQKVSGIVYLDDERVGQLPLRADHLCPGIYTLSVQFSDGQFIKEIELQEDAILSVVAEPLPSLVWFGISEEGSVTPEKEGIENWIKGLSAWNVRFVDPNNTRMVGVDDPVKTLFSPTGSVGESGRVLNRNLKADLYVAAQVVRKKRIVRFLEIAFWTPLSDKVRVYSIDLREVNRLRAILDGIDEPLPLTRSWVGIQCAKVAGEQGLKVISVHPAGPAAGKIQPGQRLTSLGGKLAQHPSQILKLPAGEAVDLEVDGNPITLVPLETISELPFRPEAYCPQAIVAKLEKLAKYSREVLVRESALFNQARYQFFLGDFQQAFDTFSTAKLDYEFGINQGTLHFYQGLCFKRLNLIQDAVASFRQVMGFPHATLFDAYGPLAAFWAETQIQEGLAPGP